MPVHEPWDEARGAEIKGLAGRDDRLSEGTRAIPEETALAADLQRRHLCGDDGYAATC